MNSDFRAIVRAAISQLDASGFPGGFSTDDNPTFDAVVERIVAASGEPESEAERVRDPERARMFDTKRLDWLENGPAIIDLGEGDKWPGPFPGRGSLRSWIDERRTETAGHVSPSEDAVAWVVVRGAVGGIGVREEQWKRKAQRARVAV